MHPFVKALQEHFHSSQKSGKSRTDGTLYEKSLPIYWYSNA